MSDRMVIAAFDVDGTLTTRDCVRPFLERAAGRRRVITSMLRRPLATVVAAARRDRDRFKEIIVGGSLRGKLIADVEPPASNSPSTSLSTGCAPTPCAGCAGINKRATASCWCRPHLPPIYDR